MKKPMKLFSTTFLAATLLFSLNDNADASFTDVKEGFWAHDEINWAKDQGLIVGYEEGNFRPSKPLTEAQFVAMLTRYSGEKITFSDDHWADFYYEFLENHKFPVVSGSHPSQRNKPIRRGDIATVLAAYKGVDFKEKEAIQYLLDKEISTGRVGATVEGYDANSYLNRAQAVTFLHRMNELGYEEFVGLASKDDSEKDTSIVEPVPDGESTTSCEPSYSTNIDGNPFAVRTLEELVSCLEEPLMQLGYEILELNHADDVYGLQVYKPDGSSSINALYIDGELTIRIFGERLQGGREALITLSNGFFPGVKKSELEDFINELHKNNIDSQRGTINLHQEKIGDYKLYYGNDHTFNRAIITISK